MAKRIIHVNRSNIAFNAKHGEAILPTYIIRYKGKSTYAHSFKLKGKVEAADPRIRKPLSCGARAWLEVEGDIELIDPMTYQESLKLKEEFLEQISES